IRDRNVTGVQTCALPIFHQRKVISGCGIAATSFQGEEIQKRSYPNSFGGQHTLQGYELVESLDLMRYAPIVAEEAAALHSASQRSEERRVGKECSSAWWP